jgi:hypothetical protein
MPHPDLSLTCRSTALARFWSSTGGSGNGGQPSGGSLYYSPYNGPQIKQYYGLFGKQTRWIYAPSPATLTMDDSQWHHKSDCTASYAVPNANGVSHGKLLTTLAGWSSGRNGPIMFLYAHPSWYSQVHYILLFDPGNVDDYTTGGCDKQYQNMSYAVLQWLSSDSRNRLVVLAGEVTADYGHPIDGRGHGGIQSVLFSAIKSNPAKDNATLRGHVVVCNYDRMNHEDVWLNFKNEMNKQQPITVSSCPAGPGYPHPLGWNP